MATIQLDATFENYYSQTLAVLQRDVETHGDKWARTNLKRAVVFLQAPPPYSHLRIVLGEQTAAIETLAGKLGITVQRVRAGKTAGIAVDRVQPFIGAWDAPVAY